MSFLIVWEVKEGSQGNLWTLEVVFQASRGRPDGRLGEKIAAKGIVGAKGVSEAGWILKVVTKYQSLS